MPLPGSWNYSTNGADLDSLCRVNHSLDDLNLKIYLVLRPSGLTLSISNESKYKLFSSNEQASISYHNPNIFSKSSVASDTSHTRTSPVVSPFKCINLQGPLGAAGNTRAGSKDS